MTDEIISDGMFANHLHREAAAHSIAMELSNGLFAWHLFGVLTVAENKIDLEEVAVDYLNTFHPEWISKCLDKLTALPAIEK